ncbi:ABC transporter substrate-binding protein [Acidilobus sp.]|uniref:ABC transporter substrate-binding protein n=1 Tax=Acidilobus sp. TaxID=1872109 RepID=UPI003CFF3713
MGNSRSSISTAALAAIVVVIVVVAVAGLAIYYTHRPSKVTTSTTPTPTTSTTTSTTSTSSQQVTLTIATYTGAPQRFLSMAAQLFEQEHPGVVIKVDAYPFTEYITNELTVLKAGESSYDIVTFTPTSARLLAPYVVPLNSSVINTSDILWPAESFGGVIYNATTNTSEMVGVAPWVSNVLIIYNTKYFDNATLQQEFYNEYHMQLNPWTWHNWTVVVDVSQFFVSHNITKYGVLIMDGTAGGDLDSSFESIYGWFYINNQSLNCGTVHGIPGFGIEFYGCYPKGWTYPFPPPAINTSAGVQALEILRELVSYEPSPTVFQVSFDNTPELFAEGYGPAAVNYASRLAAILAQNVSPSEIGLAPLPGNYSMAGGTYFGISRYSQNKQLALEFLQFVESPQVQEEMFLKLGLFPISKQAYSVLLSNSSVPAYEKNWLLANEISAEYGNAWEPLVPVTLQLGNALGNALLNYLENPTSQSPQQVLNSVAAQYISILKSYYASTTTSSS